MSEKRLQELAARRRGEEPAASSIHRFGLMHFNFTWGIRCE
jgi:hypothetical protein